METVCTKRAQVRVEFLLLMAAMMCLMGLHIDAILPALMSIGEEFDALEGNRHQLVISAVLLGMGFGQLFYGCYSDAFGRKPAAYIGFVILFIGTFISFVAQSFELLLFGRLLQGLGSAGPRVMVVAIIRDKFSGAEMARVMSLVLTIFIASPVVAPAFGQGIMLVGGWRAIVASLLVISALISIWFAFRQEETLAHEKRRPLSFRPLLKGFIEVLGHRQALIFTLCCGLVHGVLTGFITSIQGVLQSVYNAGTMFSFYFGLMAIGIALSSYINSYLVRMFDLRRLVVWVLVFLSITPLLEAVAIFKWDAHPPLWLFILMMSGSTFTFGLLFSNLNTLAMEPFGHIAGLASGLIGAVTLIMGVSVGSAIGMSFNGTAVPMLVGFSICAVLALSLILVPFRSDKRT